MKRGRIGCMLRKCQFIQLLVDNKQNKQKNEDTAQDKLVPLNCDEGLGKEEEVLCLSPTSRKSINMYIYHNVL